jgi:hypothetical protein
MNSLRYVVGLEAFPSALRQPSTGSIVAPDRHGVLEQESVSRCGKPIHHKLSENFDQAVGKCRECLALLIADDPAPVV